jgi:hypothetical protein
MCLQPQWLKLEGEDAGEDDLKESPLLFHLLLLLLAFEVVDRNAQNFALFFPPYSSTHRSLPSLLFIFIRKWSGASFSSLLFLLT